MQMAGCNLGASHLLVDNDPKFTESFDAVFEGSEVEVKRVGPQAPNMHAYVERWIQSLGTECLDHFVVCGERHLRHLIANYVAHHERPHQPSATYRFLMPRSVFALAALGGADMVSVFTRSAGFPCSMAVRICVTSAMPTSIRRPRSNWDQKPDSGASAGRTRAKRKWNRPRGPVPL
jgi:hypothetical protein